MNQYIKGALIGGFIAGAIGFVNFAIEDEKRISNETKQKQEAHKKKMKAFKEQQKRELKIYGTKSEREQKRKAKAIYDRMLIDGKYGRCMKKCKKENYDRSTAKYKNCELVCKVRRDEDRRSLKPKRK
jgi:hypothetical protein